MLCYLHLLNGGTCSAENTFTHIYICVLNIVENIRAVANVANYCIQKRGCTDRKKKSI